MSSGANAIAVASIVVIMVVVNADVVGRNLFNSPVRGAMEIASALMALVVMLSLAYGEKSKAHIRIEILVQRLSHAGQASLDVLANCLGMLLCGLIMVETWGIVVRALLGREGIESGEVYIPIFPFYLMVPLGCGLLLLQFFIGAVRSINRLRMPKDSPEASG